MEAAYSFHFFLVTNKIRRPFIRLPLKRNYDNFNKLAYPDVQSKNHRQIVKRWISRRIDLLMQRKICGFSVLHGAGGTVQSPRFDAVINGF
jgi:hypothetical protein